MSFVSDYETFDITNSNIYIDDDLNSRIENIAEKKVGEILSKKDLMSRIDETTKAKIQLIFGQDVYILPKEEK